MSFKFEPKEKMAIDPKALYVLPGQALLEIHAVLLDQLPARFSQVPQTVGTIISCSEVLPQEEPQAPAEPEALTVHQEEA